MWKELTLEDAMDLSQDSLRNVADRHVKLQET